MRPEQTERGRRRQPLPPDANHDTSPRTEATEFFPTIAYAGGSERRAQLLKLAFPHSQVISLGGGTENQALSATQIAKGKLVFAATRVVEELGKDKPKFKEPVLLVATDVRTSVLGIDEDSGVAITKCIGKPENIGDARNVFSEMSVAYEQTGTIPYYDLSIGTDIDVYNQMGKAYIAHHTTHIELDPEKVKYFSTDEGFTKYCQEAERTFSHPSYMPNGGAPSLLGIAGGLEFITLMRLHAVKKIILDRTRESSVTDRDFPEMARIVIYDALFGFLHKALKKYSPHIKKLISEWQPLNDFVEYASTGAPPISQELEI